MTDKFDAAIQEIAVRHGVLLSKDDPILILQTMNDRLIEETRQAQAAMLGQFREEMENISFQWKVDAKEKAEKVLNIALASSKETMNKILKETTNEFIHVIKNVISDSLTESKDLTQQTSKMNRFTLLMSIIILTICCIFMLFLVINFSR